MRALSETAVYALNLLHVLMRTRRPMRPKALFLDAKVPATRFMPTLRKLARGGLISGMGREGYVLARPPGLISLAEVLAALDRPEQPSAPCGGDFEACPSRASCVLAALCRKADENFREAMRDFTLSDLRESAPDLPNCLDPVVQRRQR